MTNKIISMRSYGTALQHARIGTATFLALLTLGFGLGTLDIQAKPALNTIDLIPTVTSVTLQDGQLVASGNVTAFIKGKTFTRTFSGVPINISLAPNQAVTTCPILDLQLGPITVDLLGLVVETSPICLEITAHQGGGLLGDLLCSIAHLLQTGVSLNDILAGLSTSGDLQNLLTGLTDLLNGALGNLSQAILTAISLVGAQHTCAILHLELGPLDLTLLGLEVVLDDCANGPVVVDITGQTGRGKLLGNLLCELLGGGLISIGSTLQGILNQILALLNN